MALKTGNRRALYTCWQTNLLCQQHRKAVVQGQLLSSIDIQQYSFAKILKHCMHDVQRMHAQVH